MKDYTDRFIEQFPSFKKDDLLIHITFKKRDVIKALELEPDSDVLEYVTPGIEINKVKNNCVDRK